MSSSVIFQTQSVIILLLIYFGVFIRKNRNLHPKVMTMAIIWDFILVLQIELTRSAIKKTIDVSTHSTMLNIHLFFAISTAVIFLVLLYSGSKLKKGEMHFRKKHITLGAIAVIFRTATLVTSLLLKTALH